MPQTYKNIHWVQERGIEINNIIILHNIYKKYYLQKISQTEAGII